MVKKIFAVVGSALLFLLIIGASSAADIDINNDGTFSDVQNGINQAQSGDTIYLNNHTFTGSLLLTVLLIQTKVEPVMKCLH